MKKIFLFSLYLFLVSCTTPQSGLRNPARESNQSVQDFYLQNCKRSTELNEYNSNPYNLPEAQVYAILRYTLADFISINSSNAEKTQCREVTTILLNDALDSIPGKAFEKLYRGDSAHEKLVKDQIFEVKIFMSTSTSQEVAQGFIKNRFWTIKALNGKDIIDYANSRREHEVLLPRGTLLRIDKVTPETVDIYPEGPGDVEHRKIQHIWATEVAAQFFSK